MDATLPALAEELLKEIEKAFCETSHVPDDLLLTRSSWCPCFSYSPFYPHNNLWRLKFLFGASAVPALDLVDRQSVTRITSPSGRRVYQVVGSSGRHYTCYASCHFCTCPAFAFSVLRKGDSLVCKHILAVFLSQVLGNCPELTVPDKQLTGLLLQEEE